MDDFGSTGFDEDAGPLSPALVKKGAGDAALGSLCTIKIARQAPRLSNQRAEVRRPGADEATIIRFREHNYPVVLANVSSSGAMIESDVEPFIGEPIQIQIGDAPPVPAVARWVGGGRIGVEFGNHSLLVGQPRNQHFTFGLGQAGADDAVEDEQAQVQDEAVQREPRQAVIRRAMVRAGVKRVPVRLCNISPHGVMLESDHCLTPGSAVQLEMAGGLLVTAQVRWSKGKRAGLSFDAEINTQGLGSLNLPPPTVLKPSYLESEFDPESPWAARFDRLTMKELNEDPAPISEDDAPASWRPPAR